jgi:hypothetical protein
VKIIECSTKSGYIPGNGQRSKDAAFYLAEKRPQTRLFKSLERSAWRAGDKAQ